MTENNRNAFTIRARLGVVFALFAIAPTASSAIFSDADGGRLNVCSLEQLPVGLQSGNAIPSDSGDAILATAVVLGTDWLHSLDSVRLRLGELRTMPSHIGGDVWVRTNAYRLNGSPRAPGDNFRQDTWGVTVGANGTIGVEPGSGILGGGFIQMGRSDRTYSSSGTSDTDTVGFGLFGTLYAPDSDGTFIDIVLKYDRYKNHLDARDANAVATTAGYNSGAFGISLQAGQYIEFRSIPRLWIEPSLQLATLWTGSAKFKTSEDMRVRVGRSNTWQYRAQIRAGGNLGKLTKHGDGRHGYGQWIPYVKLAVTGINTSGGKVSLDIPDKDYTARFGGARFEMGAGISYKITLVQQLYFDYEYTKSSSLERPWALNLGYRYIW